MKSVTKFALLFIATYAISSGAIGQKVYKCGSVYSQIPCAEAVTIDAADTRSKEQKAETEKAAQRDAKTANAMEKTRLKEEKEVLDAQKAAAKETGKTQAKAAEKAAKAASAASKEPAAGSKSKKKEPEFFTATPVQEKKK